MGVGKSIGGRRPSGSTRRVKDWSELLSPVEKRKIKRMLKRMQNPKWIVRQLKKWEKENPEKVLEAKLILSGKTTTHT